MREACSFTDYFVICTARNARQARAVADDVRLVLKRDHSVLPRSAAGEREGSWIVLDYLDAVVHIFTADAREFYALEQLWGDVPCLDEALVAGATRRSP